MRLRDRTELRRAMNVLGVLLLIAVVVPFLVYGFPQVVGADHGFVVLSGSMEPAMSPGDAIIVREATPEEIEERDIITYQTDSDTPTTHRVIDVVERGESVAYQTKGDANEDADPGSVSHEQVIGEVLFVIPLLGYVVKFVNTTVGFAALVVLPVVLFTLSELWALLNSVRDGTDSTARDTDGELDNTDANVTTSADEAESEGSITLTKSSLQLLGFVFALYLPYSAYVAYTTTAAWSITVAIATAIALLFVGGLYVGSGGSPSKSGGDDRGATEEVSADDSETASSVSPKHSVEADGGELVVEREPVDEAADIDDGTDHDGGSAASITSDDGDSCEQDDETSAVESTTDETNSADGADRGADPEYDISTFGAVGSQDRGGTSDE